MENQKYALNIKCEKVPTLTKNPSYAKDQALNTVYLIPDQKIVWGRQKKGKNDEGVKFKEEEISREQIYMDLHLQQNSEDKITKQLRILDLGSLSVHLQIEKGVQSMIVKNQVIKIGQDDKFIHFYVKDFLLSKGTLEFKPKTKLKQIAIPDEESTLKSGDYANNDKKLDIKFSLLYPRKDLKSQEKQFEIQISNLNQIFKIGRKNDCDWVIDECPYDVAAEIGYHHEEGWYIQQPHLVQENIPIGIGLKHYDPIQKTLETKSKAYLLSKGLKVELYNYVFKIDFQFDN